MEFVVLLIFGIGMIFVIRKTQQKRAKSYALALAPSCTLCEATLESDVCARCGFFPDPAVREDVDRFVALDAAALEFRQITEPMEKYNHISIPSGLAHHELTALDYLEGFPDIVDQIPQLDRLIDGDRMSMALRLVNEKKEEIRMQILATLSAHHGESE